MSITPATLTRGAAVAAALAGTIYIVIQFIHPAETVANLTTPAWLTVHILSYAMAVLALMGITGIYLRQVTKFGVLGLIGYLMFGLFFLLQSAFNFSEAFVAPLVAGDAPRFAEDFVGLFSKHTPVTDLGALTALPLIGSTLYVIGALIFGIAVIRSHVLSRGAGVLLIAAAAVTPIAGALLPHTLERLAAIPMGLALIWLGISLWMDQRTKAVRQGVTANESHLDRTAV